MTTGTYALLADGSTIEIRPATPEDEDAVREMHAALSPENAYFRFFSLSPRAPSARRQRVCRAAQPGPRGAAGLARRRAGRGRDATRSPGRRARPRSRSPCPTTCTAAASPRCCSSTWCRSARQRTWSAFDGRDAAGQLRDAAGIRRRRPAGRAQFADGVIELTFPLPCDEADRAWTATWTSVAARRAGPTSRACGTCSRPASVAVIGAGRRAGLAGPGDPAQHRGRWLRRRGLRGEPARPSPSRACAACPRSLDLPEGVDLAVIAVPPAEVADGRGGAAAAAASASSW